MDGWMDGRVARRWWWWWWAVMVVVIVVVVMVVVVVVVVVMVVRVRVEGECCEIGRRRSRGREMKDEALASCRLPPF